MEGDIRPIVSTAGNAAQRARSMPGEILHLLIAKDYSGLVYKSKSLAGKSVLVTRAQKQARDLTSLLQQRGANVVEVPAIEIVTVYEKKLELLQTLHVTFDYSWLILTSVNTVLILDQILKEAALDWTIFNHLSIACIGRSTAAAVRDRGAAVALRSADVSGGKSGGRTFEKRYSRKTALIAACTRIQKNLTDTLQLAGADVHEIQIYRAEIQNRAAKNFYAY